jgi:hypothetical protein
VTVGQGLRVAAELDDLGPQAARGVGLEQRDVHGDLLGRLVAERCASAARSRSSYQPVTWNRGSSSAQLATI